MELLKEVLHLAEKQETIFDKAKRIYSQAEQQAYDEAAEQHHGVSGDRIYQIAQQLVTGEDPDQAREIMNAVANLIQRYHMEASHK